MHHCLIVKLGSAPPHLRARRGDFEHYFSKRLGIDLDKCLIVNPEAGDMLPDARHFLGVVITGSDAMLTDNPDWSLRTQAWLERILPNEKIPVLGVCYGHQLLAQTLGGKIGWSENGEELGTISVTLTANGERDPLLGAVGRQFVVQAAHSQAVLELPPGARLLARNAHEPIQSFAWGTNAWGVQFHPEFDADISRTYIEDDREALEHEGRELDAMLRATRDTDHGAVLLRRFAERLHR
ncbi:MAG: glutamine amidotransferase [Gammaproteobacteria bacterium]|nr:glutamine amidotransferase [Gammaproteobacteria bacterium]